MNNFILYLITSFLMGCIVMLAEKDMGIFFDVRKWDDCPCFILILISMLLGYCSMFGFAIYYWLYRFYMFIKIKLKMKRIAHEEVR